MILRRFDFYFNFNTNLLSEEGIGLKGAFLIHVSRVVALFTLFSRNF